MVAKPRIPRILDDSGGLGTKPGPRPTNRRCGRAAEGLKLTAPTLDDQRRTTPARRGFSRVRRRAPADRRPGTAARERAIWRLAVRARSGRWVSPEPRRHR